MNTATHRYATNLATLRLYLNQIFYPFYMPDEAAVPSTEFAEPLTDPIDLCGAATADRPRNCEQCDELNYYPSTVSRAKALHKEFVTFMGVNQREWYRDFLSEWLCFTERWGESSEVAYLALRDPQLVERLSRYAFLKPVRILSAPVELVEQAPPGLITQYDTNTSRIQVAQRWYAIDSTWSFVDVDQTPIV